MPTCSLYPQQKRVYSALHPQASTCIYTGHACRHLPSAVPWISEVRLLFGGGSGGGGGRGRGRGGGRGGVGVAVGVGVGWV